MKRQDRVAGIGTVSQGDVNNIGTNQVGMIVEENRGWLAWENVVSFKKEPVSEEKTVRYVVE